MGDAIDKGREAWRRREWQAAYDALAQAARNERLDAADLERLASAAYLTGRDTDYRDALEQAHHAFLQAEQRRRAVRCAFWLGLFHLFRGERGSAGGWLSRAARLLEDERAPCAEAGYLKLPLAEQSLAAGDAAAAFAFAGEAAAIGARFADADLAAIARHQQGRARLLEGRIAEGLTLIDEAMVAVSSGQLMPIVTGLLYCSVIDACAQIHELGRAREWTAAMSRWCGEQPQMLAFRGTCLVHRAEMLQVGGDWEGALQAACAACGRDGGAGQKPPGAAFYQQGEVHRLRGEMPEAERAYREAAVRGHEPQPGLALLRLTQGKAEEAWSAMARVLGTATEPQARARLLPAAVDIALGRNALDEARRGANELQGLAQRFGSPMLAPRAAQSLGAVEIAAENPRGAVAPLREAWHACERLDAPYLGARVRELLGLACAALGDPEAGRLELEAARTVFEQLGAAADLARVSARLRPDAGHGTRVLTLREADVLRLVANGRTNKAIARELRLSVKTVDRHLSNIFTKLDVSSRAAAIAQAYRQKLL